MKKQSIEQRWNRFFNSLIIIVALIIFALGMALVVFIENFESKHPKKFPDVIDGVIIRTHDEEKGVTCYMNRNGFTTDVSCLKD